MYHKNLSKWPINMNKIRILIFCNKGYHERVGVIGMGLEEKPHSLKPSLPFSSFLILFLMFTTIVLPSSSMMEVVVCSLSVWIVESLCRKAGSYF